MQDCCVFFAVRTELLNSIQTSFGCKGCQRVDPAVEIFGDISVDDRSVGRLGMFDFGATFVLFNLLGNKGCIFNAFQFFVPHNLLKSLVLFFCQALGMEIQRYRNVCCALTD
jgi:hypothetical protein